MILEERERRVDSIVTPRASIESNLLSLSPRIINSGWVRVWSPRPYWRVIRFAAAFLAYDPHARKLVYKTLQTRSGAGVLHLTTIKFRAPNRE